MEKLLDLAITVATEAHSGQYDKGGKPYILHPIRVAESVRTTKQKIIAYLHDVCEDSSITFDDLLAAGFPEDIVDCVRTLTRKRGAGYFKYIEIIKQNEDTRCVKIADLKHNSDLSRIVNPTASDFARCEKYRKALAILENIN